MIETEVIPLRQAIQDLSREWTSLYESRANEPSLSSGWTSALLKAHLRNRDDAFAVIMRRQGSVAGIIPIVRNVDRYAGMRIASLNLVSDLYPTHSGLLLDDVNGDCLSAFMKCLTDRLTDWDIFRVSRILSDKQLVEAIQTAARLRDLNCRVRDEQPSFHLSLPDSYALYLQSRSGKFRNHLKRMQRKLDQQGGVRLTRCTQASDLEKYFEALMQIEQQSWKHKNGTAISSKPHQKLFYRQLCQQSIKDQSLHLSILWMRDRPLAHNLGLVNGPCYYYLKTSYDKQLRSSGVATVARALLIRNLIEEGFGRLDFPAEPYEWERQWTRQLRWHKSVLIFNKTAKASGLRTAISARDLVFAGKDKHLVYADPLSQ